MAATFIDVIGVFTQDFKQVFAGARPIRANVRPPSRLMEYPLETGVMVADHRIIMPVEIELSMMLQAADYKNAYRQIVQLYNNATLLIVQTKAAVYKNQVIMELPHEENTDIYDALAMGLRLRQIQFASSQVNSGGIVPANPSFTNTVDRGQIQGSAVSAGFTSGVAT